MVWPAIIAAAGAIGDAAMGSHSAHKANRTNIMLAREQRDWMEMMSNTAMQRHRKDLEEAGLNPILGMTQGGASTPSPPVAHVSPTYSGNAITSAVAAAQAVTNQKLATAQARKTNAEAAVMESHVPYSAANALAQSDLLQDQVLRIGQEIEAADIAIKRGRSEFEQLQKLQPLLLELQKLENDRKRNDLPETEAMRDFWKSDYGRTIAPYIKEGGAAGAGVVGAGAVVAGAKALINKFGKKKATETFKKLRHGPLKFDKKTGEVLRSPYGGTP